MADLEIIRSLASIERGHPVFEPDQVLTDQQLNGVIDYFDEQGRLTRVALLGVGLLAGLQVTSTASKVSLSKGVGITTDGDLLMLPVERAFDRFKPYDEGAPKYSFFYSGSTMRKVYELVAEGETDAAALPLAGLPGPGLSDMVVVLFMESYEKDQDLCTGTDCDNLGKDALHQLRALLVSRADAAALAATLPTPTKNAGTLPVLAAGRPALTGALSTTTALAALYRSACTATHTAVVAALGELHKQVPALTLQLFAGDPSPSWIARLNAIRGTFQSSGSGIQYYYGFLKDVVETWNALRDALLEEPCVLCPDWEAFPKHVLAGAISDPTQFRTAFYPSPLTCDPRGQLEHALSLAWKLHVLVNSFAIPTTSGAPAVRVTPSRSELQSLEDRAIPYYYDPSTALSIPKSWSFRRARLGTSADITGYFAAELGGSAAARNPFSGQIGQYDFFRVEGHLNQDLDVVMDELERQIRVRNLPFAVRAVLLHDSTGKLKRKPGIRYNDLHRLHKLFRTELSSELARSSTFSGAYNQGIKIAATNRQIPDNRLAQADNYNLAIKNAVDQSSKAFAKSTYSEFKAENAWPGQYELAVKTAGEFKQTFGDVSRTDYVTAFDSAIASNQRNWLKWLDVLIDDKNQKADERSLFTNYLGRHPGLEHCAGVLRGGTFVVVYDDNARVVADFMLPYRDVEEVEPEPQEPVLVDEPPSYTAGGYVFVPPLDWQLEDVKIELRDEWVKDIGIQEGYMQFFQENIDILTKFATPRDKAVTGKDVAAGITDARARYYATRVADESEQLELLKTILQDPSTPAEVVKDLRQQQETLEIQLAASVANATTYFGQSDLGTAQGSAGAKTLEIVAQGAGKITNETARKRLGEGLQAAGQAARSEVNKTAIVQLAAAQNLRF